MTRTVRFSELGEPEVLRIEEVPDPAPGPGELVVDVAAIGLNRAESMFRRGRYIEETTLPAGLGYECSGTVSALGDGVTRFAVGDRVSVVPGFSMNDYTVYADRALVPARAVVPLPETTSWVDGAAVWMPFLVGYGGLVETGGLRAGDHVLITAATSSVGLAAIAVANRVGATPIATSRSSSKAQPLLDAGAAHVVATEEEDLVARVLEITGGRGVEHVFDAIAGPGVADLAKVTATGGILTIHGLLSGQPTIFPAETLPDLWMRSYTLFAMTYDEERLRRAGAFVGAGLRSGDFRPQVDRVFSGLGTIVEAHTYLESNAQVGKIVVTP
ncbi:zinc-dependent alcohol dehydrogenase family protein [Actinomycetospora endophytica]|uniref:Zinc-dependent alcohol dehydrogenase family protein n=1 Tax=Actinomycetospora endophytica TaxID=2291215 RepID=A0ABS8PCM3_9PSEU|nr:zinc-dependent alcohol dehydrogenase family protein [Actinomycetospora endophytica]MCD2196028.1 zinc-dependent alcohol dehydrogenase family protein [Actinomycetospora endophytica]